LKVAVLPRSAREDGIVDDDAMDGLVGICFYDFLFDILLVNGAEAKIETTGEGLAAKSYNISHAVADDLCMLADHIPPEPIAESPDKADFTTRLLGNRVIFILDVNFEFSGYQLRNRACALKLQAMALCQQYSQSYQFQEEKTNYSLLIACLRTVICVDLGSGVAICQKSHELWLVPELSKPFLDLC
jgi:hypothetical protein